MSQQLPVINPLDLGLFIFECNKDFVFYPSNKPPVCFCGFEVHTFSDITNENSPEPFEYAMFITNGGNLIMKYTHERFGICIEDLNVDPIQIKVKRFATFNDVWTFFKEIDNRYIDFLAECAKKLENPTMFWLNLD